MKRADKKEADMRTEPRGVAQVTGIKGKCDIILVRMAR